MVRALFLCCWLPALVQCTFLKALVGIQPRKPTVHLLKLHVQRANLKSIELVAQLAVQNPNDFQLPFSYLRYQLAIFDETVAEGVYKEELVIRESATTVIDVPIRLHTLQVAKNLSQFLQGHKVVAKWTADANFVSPLGKIGIHLAEEKELR